ncbi:hypothetical protein ADIARSV_3889 [Arcticibacter svalbardensis MN12-7]|uniref:Uncharacterized protein n=2 Tax=Arcticibacter TaxID=1288026 RepID=R9GMH9_9SPHI|nr:hypothetical protein ADIARSV_3889 [Arcticibacter svalbardensis MN12-7]
MLKGGILAGEPSILLSFDGKENTMKFMMSSFVNSGTIDTCAKSFFKFSENDITGLRSFVINKYLKSAVSSENPTHLLLN